MIGTVPTWLAIKGEIADAVGSIDRLRGRSFHYSTRKIPGPPAFIVHLPEVMTPHGTYQSGMTMWTIPFTVVVGSISQESSEVELAHFIDESGPRSVIRAVEDRVYTSCSGVVVQTVEPTELTFAGAQYLGATFTSEVSGKGR
jgi:hypothetical protein